MTTASPSTLARASLSTAASWSSVVIGRSRATEGTPRASSSSRTRCQLHPSCQPPWTNTAVAGPVIAPTAASRDWERPHPGGTGPAGGTRGGRGEGGSRAPGQIPYTERAAFSNTHDRSSGL